MTRGAVLSTVLVALAEQAAGLSSVGRSDRLEAVKPFIVDDTPGLGLRWEGVGAISGGGATSKLLYDYPKEVQADILDYMFKPETGLDLQMLKVEIGGNTDATEGSEPSHWMGDGEENYRRGYEWWLMKEAKKRNPDIKLYGLPWGWPGGLDPEATADRPADPDRLLNHAENSANYTLQWVLGAKKYHNLTIDYVGLWNERDPPPGYSQALYKAVASSSAKDSTKVLDRLRHYPGATNVPDRQGCKQYADQDTVAKPGRGWVDEEGSIYDGRSARCLARVLNRNYISMCKTATIQWHLISSFYDYLPWARCGVAVANEPWSGAYEITSPTWAIAHTTQFNPIGWKYAEHGSGVHMLPHGGSMVSRISPDKQDFSIVVEKMDPKTSACARGFNPDHETRAEDVTIELKGSFLDAVRNRGGKLQVWYSNLASDIDIGVNPPDAQLLQKSEALEVDADGRVKFRVQPDELYTLTTLQRGGKGKAKSPEKKAFPLPFSQDFNEERGGKPAKLWYDQMGAFEIQQSPYGDHESRGNVMRQVVPVWPACWGYSCTGPTTYFGPSTFKDDTTVSMDVRMEGEGGITIEPQGLNFSALVLHTDGRWKLGKHSGTVNFAADSWHTVSLRMLPSGRQLAQVDGEELHNQKNGLLQLRGQAELAQPSCEASDFPVPTVGYKYLRLKPMPAGTPEECQANCCKMTMAGATTCNVWQFDGRNCEVGAAERFGWEKDEYSVWTGGLRGQLRGWHLRVELSRYMYASIDNFNITKN